MAGQTTVNYRLRLIEHSLPPMYELFVTFAGKEWLSHHSKEEVLQWIDNLRSDEDNAKLGNSFFIKGQSPYRARLAEYFGMVVQES